MLVTTPSCRPIDAAYTNLDPDVLARWNAPIFYQKKRLQRTKANVARNLLNILTTRGEENWYYEAIRVYSINSFRASQLENTWEYQAATTYRKKTKHYFLSLVYIVERYIIEFFGISNNWGASLARPLLIGIIIACAFASVYRHFGVFHSWSESVMASAEVTVVAGYTKYASTKDSFGVQAVFLSNMLMGVFWFAVAVPSLVNRISRVR